MRAPQRDTELTLSSGTVLLIFFGLVLFCGLCFGLGYTVGRRAVPPAQATPQSAYGSQASFQANSGLAKPSATTQTAPTQTAAMQTAAMQTVVTPSQAGIAAGPTAFPAPAEPSGAAAATPLSAAPAELTTQPLVHPAVSTGPAVMQSAQSAAPTVHPAFAQQTPLMVQIAAVQNPEDADVLVNALRKRGYAVSAFRNPADNLIHVSIGPFPTREEAIRWQQKLLNDGYNALILP